MKPKFQKRHYEAVAKAMQDTYPADEVGDNHNEVTNIALGASTAKWDQIKRRLSTMFREDNGLFDVARFEKACTPGANVRARTRRAA